MQSVVASVTEEAVVADGAGYTGDFKSIWVGVSGDVAISRDAGLTYNVYPNVPNGFFNIRGQIIGNAAAGTTATGLLACNWD